MTEETSLLPARMVNEFVYCPRLFWLEHVEREFASSHDTSTASVSTGASTTLPANFRASPSPSCAM